MPESIPLEFFRQPRPSLYTRKDILGKVYEMQEFTNVEEGYEFSKTIPPSRENSDGGPEHSEICYTPDLFNIITEINQPFKNVGGRLRFSWFLRMITSIFDSFFHNVSGFSICGLISCGT